MGINGLITVEKKARELLAMTADSGMTLEYLMTILATAQTTGVHLAKRAYWSSHQSIVVHIQVRPYATQ